VRSHGRPRLATGTEHSVNVGGAVSEIREQADTQTDTLSAVTDTLSASDHVRRVISDSAQSLYALRVLRHHGLGEAGLQTVSRAVVVSRLTYAASAVSVDWIYHRHRQPAHRSIPSPEQARQICQAMFSWWRKRTSGYLEESTTIQVTSCADCSRPRRWRHSSTVCGVVHMTDKCPITQDTWPIKTS